MLHVTAHLPKADAPGKPDASLTLRHDQRRLRRRLLALPDGTEFMLDLPAPVTLSDGDRLALSDGRSIAIVAAHEPVYEVKGRNAVHLARLAWHIGNRHLPAQIEAGRILIARDPTIRAMLIGLGATVNEYDAPFSPEPGAYGHDHTSHALLAR
jgi:urease accessory protein